MSRRHVAVLAVIVLVGAVRGLYWVAVLDVWRGDEQQHHGYVTALAEGEGVPVVGEDLIPDQLAAIAKDSPTNGRLSTQTRGVAGDPLWAAAAQQYEGGQGPLYYALLAPAHRLAAGLTPLDRLFVLRALTLALALAAVPLTWLLARAVLPDRPEAWLAAPALLVTWQSWNAVFSGLTNDALAAPLGLAALVAVAWAWRRGPTLVLAAATGGLFGLALLAKASAVTVAVPLAVGGVAALVRHRVRPLRALGWAGVASVTAAAPVLPWLAWQRRAYGGESAVDRFNAIIGPYIGRQTWGAEALDRYLGDLTRGLFNYEEHRVAFDRYSVVLLAVLAVAAVAGVTAAALRRRGDTAFAVAWLATALPLGFATYVAVVHLVLDGYGTVVGRYVAPAVAAAAVVLAAGAVLALGRRGGLAAVAVVAAVSLTLEIDLDREYVETIYLRGLPVEGAAPAIVQDRGAGFTPAATVAVAAPCPATAVGFAFRGATPDTVEVRTREATVRSGRFADEPLLGDIWMAYYAVDPPAEAFEVAITAPSLVVAAGDLNPRLTPATGVRDPVARVYCADDDPRGARFAQTHGPQHPDLPLGFVEGWPLAWAVAGWAAVVLALLSAGARFRR